MRNIIIIITLLFTINTAKSQLSSQAKIDSLLKELPKMKEDTNGVNLLQSLSFQYYNINPDKGIEYGLQGVKLAKDINWKQGEANCYNSLGTNYTGGKSNYPKGLEYYNKALNILEELGNKNGVAPILGNIGIIYHSQSNYSKALEFCFRAIKINEELGNKSGMANNLGNIAGVYFAQSNYPKALEYMHKVLNIKEELGDKGGVAYSLVNIASIYGSQSDYNKALEYYVKALFLLEEIGNKSGVASNLGNIGSLYLDISKDSVLSKINEETELVSLNKEINLNKSIDYSLQSIKIFEEIGELHYRSNRFKVLADAYTEKGDYKKAFEAFKKYKTLNDSVFNLDKAKDFASLEAKRESDVKQKEIEILKKEKEKEKLQRYAMFGGIAGLGIIIGLILIQRRKSEKLLLNVLPAKIAKRLKAKEHPIADHFEGASIMFIDIVGFTKLSSYADPKRIVSVLNDIFTIFDKLADKYGLEKIKTIGDSYMAVCGIPEINTQHAKQAALMALEVKKIMTNYKTADGTEIHFRIGIDCGAVVAGVIGEKKFIYDLWSDAVNTASRMESTGEKGQIQITENFKNELEKYEGNWNFILRGEFEIKGKGLMKTYYLGN